MFVVLMIKRIDLIVDLEFGMEEMREHSQKYEPNGKYQDIIIWLKKKLENTKCQCAHFTSNKILTRNIHMISMYKYKIYLIWPCLSHLCTHSLG